MSEQKLVTTKEYNELAEEHSTFFNAYSKLYDEKIVLVKIIQALEVKQKASNDLIRFYDDLLGEFLPDKIKVKEDKKSTKLVNMYFHEDKRIVKLYEDHENLMKKQKEDKLIWVNKKQEELKKK